MLRFTFISFQMHQPIPDPLLNFVLNLIADTPADCERARIIRQVSD